MLRTITTFILAIAINAIAMAQNTTSTNDNINAVVAQDGTGEYTRLQAAIDAAPEGRTEPWRILIKPGSYRELVHVPQTKPFIHLIGRDAQRTVIHECQNVGRLGFKFVPDSVFWAYSSHNPQAPCYSEQGSITLVEGDDFYAENITFQNDWGVDFFIGPQALAIETRCDRAAFYRCRFRSFQDTWKTSLDDKHRHYVRDCWIEGAVDYFYGSGDILVENSTFYNVRHGSIITAPAHRRDARYGYVMLNCTVDGSDAAANVDHWGVKLGRPWHNNPKSVWINTTFLIPINPDGWADMGGVPSLFAEYNSHYADGKPLDTSRRKSHYVGRGEPAPTGSCPTAITKKQAENYTYENIIMSLDGWNPRQYMGLK